MKPRQSGREPLSSPGSANTFILTGPVHSGKTSFLAERASLARSRGIPVQGYLSPAAWEGETPVGYDLLTLAAERSNPFLRKEGGAGWESVGPYYFVPETLELAQRIIRRARGPHPLVVDEIGPLELEGKGVWPALMEALDGHPGPIVLTIRDGLVEPFRLKSPRLESAIVFRVGDRAAADKALFPGSRLP